MVPVPPPKRPTLQQVALEVGVSAKTVSNAFTHPDQLSVTTRRRVLAVAERLGYGGPDPLAAALRRGRAGALGFVFGNALSYAFDDPVAVAVLGGITSVAERAGHGLLLVPSSAPTARSAAVLSEAVIDGLLAFSLADDDPLLAAALARRLPLVVIDQPDPSLLEERAPGICPPWVGIDDRTAAAAAARHLLALGHRRLGIVSFALSGTPARLTGEPAQARATYALTRRRLAGYRDAVVAAGLDWATVPVASGLTSSVDEGVAAATKLLGRASSPTGILCLSDRLAEGTLALARRLGLSVPDDLSVVGFDDAPGAEVLGLTTIRQDHRRKGELATRTLLDLLARREAEAISVLPTELVVRGTTRPPPPRAR